MKLQIDIKDTHNNSHSLIYQLIDNVITLEWVKKIKHLQNVPFDTTYSDKFYNHFTKQECIDKCKILMKKFTDLSKYVFVNDFNQEICNILHKWILKNQHSHTNVQRNDLHKIHRIIHAIEKKNNQSDYEFYSIGWGEKEGFLETKFKVDPYKFYKFPLTKGDISINWSEFGKKPNSWYREKEGTDKERFFLECKPHQTFRANFNICIKDSVEYKFDSNWYIWWEKNFQKEWIQRYNHDWDEIKEYGGILLGRCISNFSEFENIKKVFKITLI